MTAASLPESIWVTCYSGRLYVDRPSSFVWQGVRYEVAKVEEEWQEPGQKKFRVSTKGELRFGLCYDEGQDRWSITKIM